MHTLGTAGHIDHGKTTLCKLLTGIDTDRLAEEKARGISIDLGFAHMTLPSGRMLGIVDVPGHERFIRNMVAGVHGIEAVLFTIAADEGIMPQTREHLDIVRLLGVTRAIVVLTKCDLVERDWIDMVREEVRTFLAPTAFASAPIVETSREDRQSIEGLVGAMDELVSTLPARDRAGIFRMPIDRVFTLKGHGTIVTGTIIAGTVRAADTVEILPQGLGSRVRSIQSFFRAEKEGRAGERAALNLPDVEPARIERGSVACAPGVFAGSLLVDARLRLLSGLAPPFDRLPSLSRVRLHVGTTEVIARMFLLEGREIRGGEEQLVQFRLEAPIACARDDLLLVRTFSPLVTVGGGVVLDPSPAKHRRDKAVVDRLGMIEGADPARLVQDVMSRGDEVFFSTADLVAQAALPRESAEAGLARLGDEVSMLMRKARPFHYLVGRVAREGQRIAQLVAEVHRTNPLAPGVDKASLLASYNPRVDPEEFSDLLTLVMDRAGLEAAGPLVRQKGFVPALDNETAAQVATIERLLIDNPFVAPTHLEPSSGLERQTFERLLGYLRTQGTLVRLPGGLVAHRQTVDGYERKLVALLSGRDSVSVSEIKDKLDLTRKGLIPLLEHFDEKGLTIRVGTSERRLRQKE